MKTRKYYDCQMITSSGLKISNPLRLSEVNLIPKMIKENASVTIRLAETSESNHKAIFGL